MATDLTTTFEKFNSGSYYKKELMKEECVVINCAKSGVVAVKRGDYFTYKGVNYYATEDYMPSYNESTCAFDYSITFKAWYWLYESKIFKLYGTDGATQVNASSWTLTDKPSNFGKLLAKNFGIAANKVVIDADLDATVPFITVTFNGTNCIDALNNIVKELDPDCSYYEWWFVGDTLYIGKLAGSEYSGGTILSLGSQISTVNTQKGSGKAITKLYAYSGTKNITSRYGKTEPRISAQSSVTNAAGNVIGYKDTAHEVTLKMFKSSTYFYNSLSGPLELPTATTEMQVTDASRVYTQLIGLGGVVNGGDVNCKLSGIFTVYFQYDGYSTDADIVKGAISVELIKGASLFREGESIATIASETTTITSKTGCITMDLNYEGEVNTGVRITDIYAMCLKVSAQFAKWGSSNFDQNPSSVIKLSVMQKCIKWEETAIYPSCDLGSGLIFNPLGKSEYDALSRCFNQQFSNATLSSLKLVPGKIPYSWFSDPTGTPTRASIERRLISVQGSGEIEGQIIFDEVYPKMAGTLGAISIETEDEYDSNQEKTGRVLSYATFTTAIVKYIDDEDFTDTTPKIAFTSGDLKGMEFDLKRVKSDSTGTKFCIIPNENYNALIPCESFMPEQGDTFCLINIDASYYEGGDVVSAAQTELDNLAKAYLETVQADTSVYTCKMICTCGTFPTFGQKVKLKDIGLNSRVISVQFPLDVPEADYQIMVGNSPSYQRINALETKTLGLK